jgi:MFS family permease
MDSKARIFIAARGCRSFGDGFTALLLPVYLVSLGFGAYRVGLLITATLIGSAMLTFAVSHWGHRLSANRVLLACCGLMLATGIAFSQLQAYWPLVLAGFLGTLNPSGGDVSVFLPVEQSLLAHVSSGERRTVEFAHYGFAGVLTAALGSLLLGLITPLSVLTGASVRSVIQFAFAFYGFLGLLTAILYLRLPKEVVASVPQGPLGHSRQRVLHLARLFSLDAFGGGFLVQSMLSLWLLQRFQLSLSTAGILFFWWGILAAFSQLAAPPLSRRLGLIGTMVFTHGIANVCVIAAAFSPSLLGVLVFLSMRALLSSVDVPARTAYVMAAVAPSERAAAAGFTSVPRSLAAAVSPSLSGILLTMTLFGWPLLIRGGLGIVYDVLLWRTFRQIDPLND